MIGMGHALVEPCLAEGQTLTSDVLHRLFGPKVVWLLPFHDLQVRCTFSFQ